MNNRKKPTVEADISDPESDRSGLEGTLFSFDDYDNVIGFVVSQAAYRLGQALMAAIEGIGSDLRPREFAILNRLHQHGKLTQVQLAELTYKDKPAMTRMIDRLLARKLVKKIASPEDRRAYLVSLTPRGEALRNTIVPLTVTNLQNACRNIDVVDLKTTIATLKKIAVQI